MDYFPPLTTREVWNAYTDDEKWRYAVYLNSLTGVLRSRNYANTPLDSVVRMVESIKKRIDKKPFEVKV